MAEPAVTASRRRQCRMIWASSTTTTDAVTASRRRQCRIDEAVAVLSGANRTDIAAHAHKLVSTAGTLGLVELLTSSRRLMQAVGRR